MRVPSMIMVGLTGITALLLHNPTAAELRVLLADN